VIVDTSALVAVLRAENDADRYIAALVDAGSARMSSPSYVEAGAVVDANRDPVLSRRLDQLLAEAAISVEPFTVVQAQVARQAYRDFGKGSGHPAALSLGDCFSYALAMVSGEPLLYKGVDFAHTDVSAALT